ncbi:hypothetical protein FKM82_006336 [Ascaphus truei]
MALSHGTQRGGMLMLRAAAQQYGAGSGCVWALASGSLSPPGPVPASLLCRRMHLSSALTGKNLLNKFASKTKKKYWYDSPSLGNQFENKPSSLVSLMKTQRKEKREDSIRMRAVNVILYKALTNLLTTSEVNQEVYDLNVELSKVSVSVDFSVCRAYWRTAGSAEADAHIENVLHKYAPRFRHIMLTHQVLGSVPPVVFVRDKQDAVILEVAKLLAIADYGPDTDDSILDERELGELDPSLAKLSEASPKVSPFPTTSMFGIDHDDLNRQILDYKIKMKDKLKETPRIGLAQQQQEQLAELRKQNILKKKMKKKKKKGAMYDDNVTPQKYLLGTYGELNYDAEEEVSSEKELESELQEAIEELEEEDADRGTKTSPLGES